MISEREELTLKNGAVITLVNGEDGVTVNIVGFDKPIMGTYNDIKQLTMDIGEFMMVHYRDFFHGWMDKKVQEQDIESNKLAIRLRRINPQHSRIDYLAWLEGEE